MKSFTQEITEVFSRAAAEQGGIVSGANPSAFNPQDPFPLWVIQVFIIISLCHLLGYPLSKIRQPPVVAEIVGGIILGPTVMGRIPHFTEKIFPDSSMPLLSLTSTIGLVLFLFLIGLEIDVRVLKGNARSSLTISAIGMIVPFGLGVALAVALYKEFVDPAVNFGHFLLFVGVAVAITAFPVLCRILTDLNLLEDHVGVIVLSAGVGNDVVGWILLALAVALTNASSGLTALWILLAGTAFVIFMLYPVRWAFVWLAKRTGSLENGSPTLIMMTVTLLVIFASAFFTDVIGIHPIFGGFVAGLIVPHDGGFAIALVEKLEDLVCIVLIPLYFALSGLRTNLGLLNDGKSWGYIIFICTVAFWGKFLGCSVTAKLLGFSIRESGAIGTLMSCKGLVELIVLNVGLQAGILDTKVFSMFVIHAVFLTIMTTPLTLMFYPPEHRTGGARTVKRARAAKDIEGGHPNKEVRAIEEGFKTKLAVVLNRIEHLPAIMTITQLLQPPSPTRSVRSQTSSYSDKDEKSDPSKDITQEKHVAVLPHAAPPSSTGSYSKVSIDALRLIELTARTSAVMKSSEADEILHRDALISVFSTFGRLNRIPVSTSLSVVSQDSFPSSVATHARNTEAQLVIVPWHSGSAAVTNVLAEEEPAATTGYNPFDSMFTKGSSPEKTSSVVYANFVRKVFAESPADVALFIDRGSEAPGDGQHIFLPFFGGPDDRLAFRFVVQLCSNANITALVARIKKTAPINLKSPQNEDTEFSAKETEAINSLTVQSATGFPDTIYGQHNTETRIASDTEDNILWSRFTGSSPSPPLTQQARDALRRITFTEIESATPLRAIIKRAGEEAKYSDDAWKSLLLVVGRARRLAVESHHAELNSIIAEQPHASISANVTRTVGDVAAGFVASGTQASLLVMQAANTAL